MTASVNTALQRHLLRDDGQEDLCFALWYPAQGANRMTALVSEAILPEAGDRVVHGNATVNSSYLDHITRAALDKRAGIVFLHSHPYPGWQGMSHDDVVTERKLAPMTFGTTELPLLGMTLGTDGAWSARFWPRIKRNVFERAWCENVRVIGGEGLEATFNDHLVPASAFREELKRTISAWGEPAQQKLARLRYGVVGLGSVGSMVAETLARMGIQHITLIDFDAVERHNLDRLLHATTRDIGRLKIDVIGDALEQNATAASPMITRVPYSVVEEVGFREAMDCDVLFSCVDRPWGRYVLNYLAYAYQIPVIDGGILIRTRNTRMQHASWRMHGVYPGRRCLECIGQYDPNDVTLERQGHLDDPSYMGTLPAEHNLKRNENVFPFSAHLASSLVGHMLHVVLKPAGVPELGEQIYHFSDGSIETTPDGECYNECYFRGIVGRGDTEGLPITGHHQVAEDQRLRQKPLRQPWWMKLPHWFRG